MDKGDKTTGRRKEEEFTTEGRGVNTEFHGGRGGRGEEGRKRREEREKKVTVTFFFTIQPSTPFGRLGHR